MNESQLLDMLMTLGRPGRNFIARINDQVWAHVTDDVFQQIIDELDRSTDQLWDTIWSHLRNPL